MISEDEVRRIAALAKLALDAGELARMQRDLGAILDFVDQIRDVEGDGRSGAQRAPFPGAPFPGDDESGTVTPEPENPAPTTPLRPDEPGNGARCAPLRREDVAANAPRFLADHFVVPRILGGES